MNLARAWRPKTFDEIVGQELTVRILKNSLYKNQLFPVYLLSGQRGCGKTTTGRILAAAVNCEQRALFVARPQEVVLPCLTCASCIAMSSGNHPDFIEIDAASHTGVDNVRSLIESSSYLPILGKYKVYLIDEAHMLSKAAFNAFLKILEEPSASVLFMLATTDPQKIIDTVKSRCFQLFFDPVPKEILYEHLVAVCKKEGIPYEDAGIYALVSKAEGSVRDALNILERIRLAVEIITEKSVRQTLGIIDIKIIITAMEYVLSDLPKLLLYMQTTMSVYAASDVWEQLRIVIREVIWQTQGCSSGIMPSNDEIKILAKKQTVAYFVRCLELLYAYEPLFNKAHIQHEVIQLVLIKMAHINMHGAQKPEPLVKTEKIEKINIQSSGWGLFLEKMSLGDQLLFSLFKQATVRSHENDMVHIEFPAKLQFFKEKFEAVDLWKPSFVAVYGNSAQAQFSFMGVAEVSEVKKNKEMRENIAEKTPLEKHVVMGEKAQMITRIFGGTIQEVKEN